MFKLRLMASVAVLHSLAFNSDVIDTVLIHRDGQDVRVNRADYDADQASESPSMKLATQKAQDAAAAVPVVTAGITTPVPANVIIPPAPSAPAVTSGGPAPDGNGVTPAPETAVGHQPVDQATGAATPATPAPNARLLIKEGNKYFIVDATGTKVTGEGIDAKGYPSEDKGWEAVRALPPVTA